MTTWIGGILVGGNSQRMGRDKASLPWHDDRSMAAHCATILKPCCHDVVTIGRDSTRDVDLIDRRKNAGPLAGIETLLCSDLGTDYLILCCDQPLVTSSLMRQLQDDGPLTVFRCADGTVEPFPLHVGASMATSCTSALDRGVRSVTAWLASLSPLAVPLPDDQDGALISLNDPKEYARALAGSRVTLPRSR